MNKKTIRDLPDAAIRGRPVLVRVDYNVPIDAGRVADDTRIVATLPTLRWLQEREARVILVSHLGRPKGKPDPAFSLEPVAARLSEVIGSPVKFVATPADGMSAAAFGAADDPGFVMLENLRFEPGEEANDERLARSLAGLADVYVNDAFGTAHRAHASTYGAPAVMKAAGKPAVAGLLVEKELAFLGRALTLPRRPFIAILGGAKISGKIDVIESLLPRVDALLIGGAMANTFFRALGLETGASLVEEDRVDMARELVQRAGAKVVLPVDCVVAAEAAANATPEVRQRADVTTGMKILDIGPASVMLFARRIAEAATILWNGPVGLFEMEPFSRGTHGVAEAVAAATARGATTVAGGGDTAAALEQAGLADRLSHVSTGGGASLEFLEGRSLPGIAILDDA
ncbi:MAG: phosphoglycerate kinase [Gemmatimonadetes bacterium]|nr:phosphoglycerate kinase [Gemmatimonadota bacterium]